MKKFVMVIMLVVFGFSYAITFPRSVYICVTDCNGDEFDFSSSPYDNVTFQCWMIERPDNIMDQNSYDAGYLQDDFILEAGISSIYFNLGNFPGGVGWAPGETLYVVVKHDSNPHDSMWMEGTKTYTILMDNSCDPIFIGWDKYYGTSDTGMPVSTSSLVVNNTTAPKTFVYPCVTTDGTDYNFVGLPVETGWTKASDFDPSGTNIESVTRYDAVNQGCETGVYSSVFGWCKDFPVQTGGAYMINAKNNFDFTVAGDSVNVTYDLLTTAGTDYNYIVHPLTKAALTTAADLGSDIGTANVSTVTKWNNSTQTWVSTSYNVMLGWIPNITSEVGMPLIVNMKQNVTWPSGKVYDGDSEVSVNDNSEKNTKSNSARARIAFFHLTEDSGRELTDDEMKLIQFHAYISARPTELLNENSYDCGFMRINGMSVLYVNLGNFPTSWTAGEFLKVIDENFNPGYGFLLSLMIDSSSSTIYYGFEDQIPGSGTPWPVDMDHINPLTGVDPSIREESGNIVLEWGIAGGDVTGYNIYSSDEPYGTFSYVTTTSNLSWSTAATENKKFFYVVSTNAKSSVAPKTITVKEKK